MMSAFDSVTKRRALVVALVGSPPSSSTITFSGTPPISFGTNSSALRSGIPSAAPGPVVVIVMPMVISLVSAIAGDPGNATVSASAAADRKALFIHSSLRRLFIADQHSLGHSTPYFGYKGEKAAQPAMNFATISSGTGADFNLPGSSG